MHTTANRRGARKRRGTSHSELSPIELRPIELRPIELSPIELSTAQWRALERLTETLLPRDEHAGAADADVIGFLRAALAAGRWARFGELLTSGLATIDAIARARHGRVFASCTCEERDAVLIEVSCVPHPRAQRFLRLVVVMTLAGFLCHPRHGGNRGRIGWGVIGWSPVEPARSSDVP
jgi:gluconate 2-dehydrogenase gamma chain